MRHTYSQAQMKERKTHSKEHFLSFLFCPHFYPALLVTSFGLYISFFHDRPSSYIKREPVREAERELLMMRRDSSSDFFRSLISSRRG